MHSLANFSRRTVYLITIICILIIGLTSGCKVNDPERLKPEGTFSIHAEGTSSTEAWLRIKAEAVSPNDIISLQRDGRAVLSFVLYGKDTLICQDSLTPGVQYNYRAVKSTSKNVYTSEEVIIRTMDTTSHDFHFRRFVVCNRSSGLRDVAIINENDIWAVGNMYTNLPEGKDDTEPVGAVHWDGKEWKQVKVPNRDTWMSPLRPSWLSSVIAFASDNVYLASYGGLIKWDGKKFEEKAQFVQDDSFNGSVYDIWGSDEKNIYAVGYHGAIYHYTGDKWHKIQSGTDLSIQSVWGSRDPVTGEEIVLCVASVPYTTDGRMVLQIKDDKVIELPADGLNFSLYSIWFKDLNKVYISGSASFIKNLKSGSEQWNKFSKNVTPYWSLQVKGNDLNDIFLAGAYGDICHFNGKTWKNYMGSETEMFYGNFYGMDIKGNTICAVGGTGREPIILLGQR